MKTSTPNDRDSQSRSYSFAEDFCDLIIQVGAPCVLLVLVLHDLRPDRHFDALLMFFTYIAWMLAYNAFLILSRLRHIWHDLEHDRDELHEQIDAVGRRIAYLKFPSAEMSQPRPEPSLVDSWCNTDGFSLTGAYTPVTAPQKAHSLSETAQP